MNELIFPRADVVSAVRTQWSLLAADAGRLAPTLARELIHWVGKILGPRPELAFTARESYPLVHLPFWAAPDLSPEAMAPIVRSTISGYLYVRLVDNAFDADTDGGELNILPVASYLHTEFQLPYQQLFPFDHPFWDTFASAWARAADAALADHLLGNPDVDAFELVAARKTTAAIIPVTAALYAGGEPHRIPAWARFIDSFGRWHQVENDFFGWRKDQRNGNPNLILGEALRRGLDPEQWFAKEGFDWGARLLSRYADDVAVSARTLACAELVSYAAARLSAQRARLDALRLGISEEARLERLLATAAGRQDDVRFGHNSKD
jgi:hypothetical protein